jgi:hypothetical protein
MKTLRPNSIIIATSFAVMIHTLSIIYMQERVTTFLLVFRADAGNSV